MKKLLFSLFALALCSLGGFANDETPVAERRPLAVIKPAVDASFGEAQCQALWQALEGAAMTYSLQPAKPDQTGFEVIMRSALPALVTEIQFQGTHLVDKEGVQLEPEKIQGVSVLLCSSVVKFDDTWMLHLYLVDAATGKLLPEYRFLDSFNSLGRLINTLDSSMAVLFGKRKTLDAVLLYSALALPAEIQQSGDAFDAALRMQLLGTVSLASTEATSAAAHAMGLASAAELNARDWPRFATLLGVRYIIEPRFTTASLTKGEVANPYGNGPGMPYCQFELAGVLRVIEAATGELLTEVPMPRVSKRNADFNHTADQFVAVDVPQMLEKAADEAGVTLVNAWKQLTAPASASAPAPASASASAPASAAPEQK